MKDTVLSYVSTIEKQYQIAPSVLKLLPKIALCESDGSTTATHYNKNGTIDYGYFQINSVHKGAMKEMGLDYYNATDSIVYALHLASTEGVDPWYSSKKCWDQ